MYHCGGNRKEGTKALTEQIRQYVTLAIEIALYLHVIYTDTKQ